MARPLRLGFSGALCHVSSRGNTRADVFACDAVRVLLLKILGQVVKHFNWPCP